jgi:hypothetical protein
MRTTDQISDPTWEDIHDRDAEISRLRSQVARMEEGDPVPKRRLTLKDVDRAFDRVVEQQEDYGHDGEYEDDKANPFTHLMGRCLLQLYQTHPKGITGCLRAVRHVTSRVFRLDEE